MSIAPFALSEPYSGNHSRPFLDQIPNIALRIYRSINLDDTLNTAVEEVRQLLQTDRVLIYQLGSHHNGKVLAESVAAPWPSLRHMALDDSVTTQSYLKEAIGNNICTISNLSEATIAKSFQTMLQRYQTEAQLIIPILYDSQAARSLDLYLQGIEQQSQQPNRLWGWMILHHCSSCRNWSPIEIAFLQQLVSHIGISVQKIKLRKLSERLIDSSTDGIIAFDRELRFITWNSAMEKISGLPRSQVLGKMALEVFPHLWEMQEDYYFFQALQGRSMISKNHHFPFPKSQNQDFFEAYYSPLRDEDEEISGGVCILRDITQQEITQQQLAQAKTKAEAANQAKSDFLAAMSHEIRTPMNAVMGMAELLRETPLSSEQQSYVDTIMQGSDTLVTLINDILDFSKIEAGKLDIESQRFNLRQCIHGAIDLIKSQAAQKQLELQVNIASDVPIEVIGDAIRLRQILINLLNNAIKFTPQGEIQIYCKHYQSDFSSDSHILRFMIRDTGVGIPPDKLPNMFQAFSQADSSVTRKYGGTGLGLAICKRLCELMGGQIGVESHGAIGGEMPPDCIADHSVGATFCFQIRVQVAPPVQAETTTVLGQTASNQPFDSSWGTSYPLSILVADDVRMNQKLLLALLQKFGYQADVVENGKAAIIAVRAKQYDLVLMDVQMPEMDGVTATQIIRQDTTIATQPWIVAVTANAMAGMREEYLSQGLNDYLTKPIQRPALIKTLQTAYRQSCASQTPVSHRMGQSP